ncbi:MAG TPA: hypothetical protein VF134_02485 [Candidatus Dormibacteraeota bacterium]
MRNVLVRGGSVEVAAGITKSAPDPSGGVIDRDASGEATGILREKAVELVRRAVPEPGDRAARRTGTAQ